MRENEFSLQRPVTNQLNKIKFSKYTTKTELIPDI